MKAKKITLTKQEVTEIIKTSLEEVKSKLHNVALALGHIKNNKKPTTFNRDLQKRTQNNDIKKTLTSVNKEVNQLESLLYEEKMQTFADLVLVKLPKNSQETSDFKKEIQNFNEEIQKYLTFKNNIKKYYGDPYNELTYFLHTLIHVYNGDYRPRNLSFLYTIFMIVKELVVAIVNFVIAIPNTIVGLFTSPDKKPIIPYIPLNITITTPDLYRMQILTKSNKYRGIVENDIQLEIKRLENLNFKEMTDSAENTYTVTLRNDDKQAYLNNLRERFISDLLYSDILSVNDNDKRIQKEQKEYKKVLNNTEKKEVDTKLSKKQPERAIENLLSSIAKPRNIRFAEIAKVKEFTTSAAELYMARVDVEKDNWEESYQLFNLYEKAAAENDIKAIKNLGDEAKDFSDNIKDFSDNIREWFLLKMNLKKSERRKKFEKLVDGIVNAICEEKEQNQLINLYKKVANEKNPEVIEELRNDAKNFSDNKKYNTTVDAICDKNKDDESIKKIINKRHHKVKSFENSIDQLYTDFDKRSKDERNFRENIRNFRASRLLKEVKENSIDQLYTDFDERSKDEKNRKSSRLLKDVKLSIELVNTSHQPPNYKEDNPQPKKSALKKQ